MSENTVQEIYTDRAAAYHWFIRCVGYEHGLGAVLAASDCLRPGARILDAGCGSGMLTRILHGQAAERNIANVSFDGFDLTQHMLDLFEEWISKNAASTIQTQRANVLEPGDLPDDWRDYDVVVTASMLEHLPKEELGKALTHLLSRLNDNGKMLVFITRQNIITKWLIRRWWTANLYKPQEIEHQLREAGFAHVQFKTFPFPFTYLNLWGLVIEAAR